LLEKIQITNRARNLIVLILALFFILLCAWCLMVTRSWINRPFPGFLVLKNNFVPILWLAEWEGSKRGIRYGDVIVAVNGQPITLADELDEIIAENKPGTPLTYTIRRGKQELQKTVPISVFTLRDYLICVPAPMLLGSPFFLMGLVVIYLKPRSPASWSFLLMGVVGSLTIGCLGEHCMTRGNIIPLIGLPLIGPSFLLIGLYFPVEIKRENIFWPSWA